jgi:hypothetical protein
MDFSPAFLTSLTCFIASQLGLFSYGKDGHFDGWLDFDLTCYRRRIRHSLHHRGLLDLRPNARSQLLFLRPSEGSGAVFGFAGNFPVF